MYRSSIPYTYIHTHTYIYIYIYIYNFIEFAFDGLKFDGRNIENGIDVIPLLRACIPPIRCRVSR